MAEEYKVEGNKAYSAKNYRQAIGKYHRALMYLRGVTHSGKPSFADLMSPDVPDKKIPEPILRRIDVLTTECYNNLAACLLASDNPKHEKVVEYCERVLDLEPENVKATFRMGTALVQLGNYEKAKKVLTSNKACATEKQIQNLLIKVDAHLKESEKQLEDAYRRMFRTQPQTDKSSVKNITDFTHTEGCLTAGGAEDGACKTVPEAESERHENGVEAENGDKSEGSQGGKIILVSSINPEGEEEQAMEGV